MIERHWTGVLRRDAAEHYIAHLRDEVFPALRKLDGFAGATAVTRDVDDGVEVRVVTTWSSREAIERFAGADVTIAVIADSAKAMLVRFDERATHFDLRLRG
jgi:heme-degrading monooxygenase HmoA